MSNLTVPQAGSSSSSLLRAIAVGGVVVGILDAIDAIIAYKVFAGFDPIPIYQFVASGLVGKTAFSGGNGSALLGLAIHFLIAFAAVAIYAAAAPRLPVLRTNWVVSGLLYGAAFYLVMAFIIIPTSAIEPSPFSLPLFINGLIGHALLVGLPSAYFVRQAIAP